MRFVWTYQDIGLWMQNFLDLDVQVVAYTTDSGEFTVISPAIGIRKLLPESYNQYQQLFHIEDVDTTAITINISGPYERDEMFRNMLVKYVNYCLKEDVMETIPHGRIKIHLDKIEWTRHISLSTLVLTARGLEIEFAEDLNLYTHLRMLQMLLLSGYTRVHIIPTDMPYQGYWFSDGTLEYTLKMSDHPADIRLCSSFHVMEWIGLEGKITPKSFHPLYPTTQIDYQYGEVKVEIPVTIAEPEINTTTLQRNSKRMQEEIADAIAEVLEELQPAQFD